MTTPCNKCNEVITTNHICAPQPCVELQNCECTTKLGTDCVTYTGDDLPCTKIKKNTIITDAWKQLDNFICKAILDLNKTFNLINIGLITNAKIYKGVTLLGEKELRSIAKTGNLITLVENPNDITLGIDTANLTTFVTGLAPAQKTYSTTNIGTGANIFKDNTIVGNNTQFNLRKITKKDLGVGASVIASIQESVAGNEIEISVKKFKTDNLGLQGESILKTETEGTNDITISAKKIASKGSLIIETSVDGNTIYIDTPTTANIAGLFVNNDYAPTYNEWLTENKAKNGGTAVVGFLFRGLGTMAQPFTDTRLYTLGAPLTSPTIIANSSIANALLAFVGTGTRLLPQLVGQKIRVQKSTIPYTYSGNFSYSNLYAVLEADVNCTTTDWLVDMDNASYFNALNSIYTIEIVENIILSILNSQGFRNSGNTDNTLPIFSTGRTGFLIGNGIIYSPYNGANVLTQYILNGNGNINNGNLQFQVKCQLLADYQGIYFTQNTQRIDFYNLSTSGRFLGSVNLALKAFHMTGGQVRFYEKGAVRISAETSGRTYGFTFQPTGTGIGNTSFQLNSAKISGISQYCFAKLNNEVVQFNAFNSPSGEGFKTVNLGTNDIINGLFENLGGTRWSIDFKNNVFSFTGIDQTKVDLTQGNNVSTSNFIGSNIIESLVTRASRTIAASNLPLGSVFLNTGGIISPTTNWIRDIVI